MAAIVAAGAEVAKAGEEPFNPMVLITEGKNPRGIPTAKFIENVDVFLEHPKLTVEGALGALNDLYSKYKYMETSFARSKDSYKAKIPETTQTIELVRMMIKKSNEGEEMTTNYSLCDTMYAKASVDTASRKVYLWIGASTMVEYNYDEALVLLEKQLEETKLKLEELMEDLYHLRGNSITVEVNMARMFNHSVKLKKAREAAAQGLPAPPIK
jgi:prefoldin subunit 5